MTGNFPVGGPVPPAYGPGYAPPSSKSSRAGVWLGSIACVLAAAALVVGVVALVTPRTATAASPQQTEAPKTSVEELFVDDADRPRCEAISSLMRESNDVTNAFLAKGNSESAERRAATPQFKADTLRIARGLEALLAEHASPPRYLTRTLQDYVDGMLLYSENVYPDRGADPFDKATYDASVVAYGGPLATCYKLGIRW